jgi:hypothetical protein
MPREYYETIFSNAIKRANEKAPGIMSWSDIRFELDKARSKYVADAVASLITSYTPQDLDMAYQVVLEKEHEMRQTPSQSSTADVAAAEVQVAVELPKPIKKPGKKKGAAKP